MNSCKHKNVEVTDWGLTQPVWKCDDCGNYGRNATAEEVQSQECIDIFEGECEKLRCKIKDLQKSIDVFEGGIQIVKGDLSKAKYLKIEVYE